MQSTILEKSHSRTKVRILLNVHRKEQVHAQRIHTLFLKTNNSVESDKKQSFLVNSLFVLVEELTCRKRCQTEGAQERASFWPNVAANFCEKTQYCQITQ
jgi:hypothetical protein